MPIMRWRKHQRTAHNPSLNDSSLVAHCPFCGSGQISARSDDSVECSYCDAVFTVIVNPTNPGAPQTVNGQPYDFATTPDVDATQEKPVSSPDQAGTPGEDPASQGPPGAPDAGKRHPTDPPKPGGGAAPGGPPAAGKRHPTDPPKTANLSLAGRKVSEDEMIRMLRQQG